MTNDEGDEADAGTKLNENGVGGGNGIGVKMEIDRGRDSD